MKWFEYKKEVDALHASDALKARLLALQADGAQGAAPQAGQTSAQSAAPQAAQTPAQSTVPQAGQTPAQSTVPQAGQTANSTPAGAAPRPAPYYAAPAGKARPKLVWVGRLAACAACFAAGAVLCDAMGWQPIPRMGSTGYGLSNYTVSEEQAASVTASAAADEAGGVQYSAAANTADGSAGIDTKASGSSVSVPDQNASRKIIYTASLTLESKDYDGTLAKLQAALTAAGGYVESSEESNYLGDSRSLNCTYRIPAANYQSFLKAAAGAGSLTDKSESTNDITAQYVDVQARIDALTTQRDRLLALEAQASTLDELLQIEDSLTNVQYELESYQSQQKLYDDQVEYCTVTIQLAEVTTYTPVQTTFWQRVANAFSNALTAFGSALESLLLFVISLWPWLAAAGIIAGITLLIRKKRRSAHP